jgi:cytochrome d ubiquinol oxidase subunit I
MHGLNTLEHQPAKVAAIEAIWTTERGVPLVLFAVPNAKERRNDYAIEVPNGASLILRHQADGELKGLDEFEGKHPPVAPVFYAFRIMVGIGSLMLATAWLGVWFLWRRRAMPRWFTIGLAAMTFSGWIATVAGWIVTEVGRQPYLVYGVMTTAEAASDVPAGAIGITLAAYAFVYAALMLSYMVVLTQLARKDADGSDQAPSESLPLRPAAV